jgi:enamine deaminase RidA (YjgF/YER057c/UK114 family)
MPKRKKSQLQQVKVVRRTQIEWAGLVGLPICISGVDMKRISSGGEFEAKVGYCRAVVAGGFVHVAGTVGQGDDVTAQCRDALRVIADALTQAGSSIADVVRVTYMLPDRAEFAPCWPILSETFGENPPAATMIECGLIDPKYRIEIEVTALLSA